MPLTEFPSTAPVLSVIAKSLRENSQKFAKKYIFGLIVIPEVYILILQSVNLQKMFTFEENTLDYIDVGNDVDKIHYLKRKLMTLDFFF